jgi:ribosomal protein S18 acetylase RimI-like enzyme
MEIVVRAAQMQDVEAVHAVFAAARRAGLSFLPVLHSAAADRAFLAGVIDDFHVSVAVVDGVVAGFLALGPGRVEHLYVDPAYWRRGIGTRLLRAAQAARPAGLDLWVFQRNGAAIAFYERHGFQVAETTDGAGNDEREPDALMVWLGT